MAASTSLPEIARYALLHLRRSRTAGGSLPGRGAPDLCPAPVVSLTTIPSRIGRLRPALHSLLDQTLPPARIYLALPAWSLREKRPYAVPRWLRSHPLVTILPSEKDWGPATKLIPALRLHQADPDRAILAVDDDNVYPRRFIETFARYARELPDAALSLRGWPMPESLRWKESREFTGAGIDTPVETDVITGCGGILVRPRFFGPAFFDYTPAPPQAFFVDDIWISGHLARSGIAKYVIPFAGGRVYLPSLASLWGPALDKTENRTGCNNDRVIDYFRTDWRFPSRGAEGKGTDRAEAAETAGGETDSVLRRTDPAVVGGLYRLLSAFREVACREPFPFWLCEGSFLGAIRHGGIIPWDDDADLQFFREDEGKLWALRGALGRRGLVLTKWWGGYKCFPADGAPVRGESHRYPFIDLFPAKRVAGGRIVYARLRARLAWRHIFFDEGELLPLVERPFGPLFLPCPARHEGYFRRNYGEDWDKVAYLTFDHRNEKKLRPRKVALVDREPAKYFP